MNITKLEMCNRVAQRFGDVPVSELKPILETFLDEILNALSEGRKIEFRGFGTFTAKIRKSRVGRNPRTGEIINVPEYTAPIFKFSRDAQKTFEVKSSKVEERRKAARKTRKRKIEKDTQELQSEIPAETTAENFSPV